MASKKKKAKKSRGAKGWGKTTGWGVTKTFYRGQAHSPHASSRRSCKHCLEPHSTSQHNAHAIQGTGEVLPAFALTHKHAKGRLKAVKGIFKGAMKDYK